MHKLPFLTKADLRDAYPYGLLVKPMGRNDDMLIIRGVNVFPSQIETVLLNEDHAGNQSFRTFGCSEEYCKK